MHSTELGTAIRNFRLQRRQIHNGQPWTLEDLAVAIGSDKAHVSRYEHGQTIPNQPTVFRIAHALETLRDLLTSHAQTITVPNIQKTVAEYFGLRLTDLLSMSRSRSHNG